MPAIELTALPYSGDSAALFARLRLLPHAVFLDSAHAFGQRGRYDILSADPIELIEATAENTFGFDGYCAFFHRLESRLKAALPRVDNPNALPFTGGAIGLFGYDLGRLNAALPARDATAPALPLASVGLYDWAVVIDHWQQQSWLLFHPACSADKRRDINVRLQEAAPSAADFQLLTPPVSNLDWPAYQRAFARVQAYIQAGDCYQVNLAQRFSAEFRGDPWQAYLRLRRTAAAPFSAYLHWPGFDLLSSSPERFLELRGRCARTSPIKGTAARSADPMQDRALADQLAASSKDQAENLMIVDLLRNDLGKSCLPGSIEVEALFELETFNTVHHLVSTISGQLRPDANALSLLSSCFPGGSITGAPKRRAMQIIDELEPHARSAYCGSVAYLSCDGQMDSNVAIRSMVCTEEKLYCWAGGGIVADSDAEGEYRECHTKVDRLLAALDVD